MRLLFDGGAFQQGIHGGILNVSVNFLNALRRRHPSISVYLLADERFGALVPEAMARLHFVPPVLRIDTRPAGVGKARLLTPDPGLAVLIDGHRVAVSWQNNMLGFAVPLGADMIEIVSRHARPKDVLEGSNDPRDLGVAIHKVTIVAGERRTDFFADQPIFDRAGGGAEQGFRWTSGRFALPPLLVGAARGAEVEVSIRHTIAYPLFDGEFDHYLAPLLSERIHWNKALFNMGLTALLQKNRIDAYCANHFIPVVPGATGMFSFAHDVLPLSNPEFFDPDAIENFDNVKKTFEASDTVFCVSRLTRDELLRYTSTDARRAVVTGNGVAPTINRKSRDQVLQFRRDRELDRPYFVCLATIEPRKNHLRLVQAYKLLLDRRPDAPQLVLAGKRGWGCDEVFAEIHRLRLWDRVRHLDHIEDDDIPLLYSGAEACIYPSLREGFGLPVLEAMACGIPVITSRNSSMEEFAAGAAIFVDPLLPSSIAIGMASVLEDHALVASLLAAAPAIVERHSWDLIAREIGDIMIGARQ